MTQPNEYFTHVADAEWIQQREDYWQEHIEYRLKQDRFSKKQIQVIKNYYFSGDIESVLKDLKSNKNNFDIADILSFCPFRNKDEFDYIVHYYCEHYLPDRISQGAEKLEHAQSSVNHFLLGLAYHLEDPFTGQPFAKEMVALLFGDTFKPLVKYPESFPLIGQPVLNINPNQLIQRLLPGICDYLFDDIRHVSHSAYIDSVSYCLSLFAYIDTSPFSLALIKDNYCVDKYNPYLNQGTYRMFFANIYGYMHEYNEPERFGFFDAELQEYLKCEIEKMRLGSKYDAMIDMIHRHKGNVVEMSE